MSDTPHIERWTRTVVDVEGDIEVNLYGGSDRLLKFSVTVFTARAECRPLFGPPVEGDEGVEHVFTFEKGAWKPSGEVRPVSPSASGPVSARQKRRASVDRVMSVIGDAIQDAIDQDEQNRANFPRTHHTRNLVGIIEQHGLTRPSRRRGAPRAIDGTKASQRPNGTTYVDLGRELHVEPRSIGNRVWRDRSRQFIPPSLEQRRADEPVPSGAKDPLFQEPFFAAMKLPGR